MVKKTITTGTLFRPTRLPSNGTSFYLALNQANDDFLCIRANSSVLVEDDWASQYDVRCKGGLFQVWNQVIIPVDQVETIQGKVSEDELSYLQEVYEAWQKDSQPQLSEKYAIGDPIHTWSEKDLVEEKISKTSLQYRRNEKRYHFHEAERLANERLKRLLLPQDNDLCQSIQLWQKPGKLVLTGLTKQLSVCLNGAMIHLYWSDKCGAPALNFSSSTVGFFSAVDWVQDNKGYHFSQPIPEHTQTLLLSSSNWDVSLLIEPTFEEYMADDRSLALALFAVTKASSEEFMIRPPHLSYHQNKKRPFPRGYLDHQTISMVNKELLSRKDNLGHLISMALACANLSSQIRLQAFQLAEKMVAEKGTLRQGGKSHFSEVAERLKAWQGSAMQYQPSWFCKTAFAAWHRQMTKYYDDDYDLLIDEYYALELEEEAIELIEKIKASYSGNTWLEKIISYLQNLTWYYYSGAVTTAVIAILIMTSTLQSPTNFELIVQSYQTAGNKHSFSQKLQVYPYESTMHNLETNQQASKTLRYFYYQGGRTGRLLFQAISSESVSESTLKAQEELTANLSRQQELLFQLGAWTTLLKQIGIEREIFPVSFWKEQGKIADNLLRQLSQFDNLGTIWPDALKIRDLLLLAEQGNSNFIFHNEISSRVFELEKNINVL